MTGQTGRKERVDAWYADIPEDERWRLYGWTTPPASPEEAESRPWIKTYEDAVAVIAEHFGGRVQTPGRTAWYNFTAHMRTRRLVAINTPRVRGSGEAAADMAEAAAIPAAQMVAAFNALATDAAMDRDEEKCRVFANAAKMIADADRAERELALKAKDLELKRRDSDRKDEELKIAQAKLEIEQAKNAKAVEAVEDATITDEERVAKIKGIFGIK